MMAAYAAGHVARATASIFARSFASARLTITPSLVMAARLPDQRDKAMTNPLPVFRVSRQIPGEDSFFVEEPPEQERHHRGDRKETPVRAERQRRPEDVERSAGVHRMPDDGVRSRGDDRLAGRDLDGRCRVAVDAIDEEDEVVADRHEDVTQDDGRDRNGGPPEATVERGHNEQCDEAE